MKKKYDSHSKINKPWANIYPKDPTEELYYSGLYYCRDGVVECTSEPSRNISYFRFVYQGTLYTRTLQKSYLSRGLTTMAGKFVKEVINELNKQNNE